MIVPLCPICGHQMYFVGPINVETSAFNLVRYACVHCDHVEDMVSTDADETQVMF